MTYEELQQLEKLSNLADCEDERAILELPHELYAVRHDLIARCKRLMAYDAAKHVIVTNNGTFRFAGKT